MQPHSFVYILAVNNGCFHTTIVELSSCDRDLEYVWLLIVMVKLCVNLVSYSTQYALNWHLIYGGISPKVKIHRSRNKKFEVGGHFSLLLPVTHQEHFCLLFLSPYALFVYRSWY